MAARWAGRKGRRWRALCTQVYADPHETHCVRCGRWVDKTLTGCAPQSRSVDHITALDQGGHPYSRDNVAIAHFGCNSAHGARVRWDKHRRITHTPGRLIVDIDPATL